MVVSDAAGSVDRSVGDVMVEVSKVEETAVEVFSNSVESFAVVRIEAEYVSVSLGAEISLVFAVTATVEETNIVPLVFGVPVPASDGIKVVRFVIEDVG